MSRDAGVYAISALVTCMIRESQGGERPRTRRSVLAGASAGLSAALVGCLGLFEDEAATELAELRVRLEEMESGLAGRDETIAHQAEFIEHLQTELSREQARVDELEAAFAQETMENEELRAEISSLKTEVEATNRRFEAWNIWNIDEADLSTLEALSHQWVDSVVVIDVITDDGRWSLGTGWVYDETVVATNAHVLRPERLPPERPVSRYDVWTYQGQRRRGELLGVTFGEDDIFETREDIGFLQVPSAVGRNRVMNRGVTRDLTVDEPLLQIGHPWSVGFWIRAVGPFLTHREPFFASNVPGQAGVSGSPVIDTAGEVVGMTWGGHYHRAPQRQPGDPPSAGEDTLMTTFEESVNGVHSYMGRIETAYEELTS